MRIDEAKKMCEDAEKRLLRLISGILLLEGEDRRHAGYKDAEEMVKSCKNLIKQHKTSITKLLDSIPEEP